MKIIFLDIDGVMNNVYSSVKARHSSRFEIINRDNEVITVRDDFCWLGFEILNRIVDKTGAKIVLSSTWRRFTTQNEMTQIFKHYKCKGELIDYTPYLHISDIDDIYEYDYMQRGTEIQKWLDDCEFDIESFIIIDDDGDMVHLKDRLVKTDCHFGLNHTHEDICVEMLNNTCN